MMDPSIAAEGLNRLSAISLLLLCGGTLACSDGEPVDLQAREAGEATDRPVPWGNPELAEEQGLLWDTPPLPSPMTLIIDGKVVLDEITHSFLLTPWSTHCADEGFGLDVAQLTEGFLADPEELFYPLVRGVLLLREAEARFPKLNDEEVEHFQKQMEVAVGTAMEALLDRYGQDGWERHVQRQLRKRLLKAEFSALAPEVTEDDVYRLYDTDVLAKLPNLDPAVGEDVSFAALEPKLRFRLEQDRATEMEEAWIDVELEGRAIEVILPDGRTESWTTHSPEQD